VARLTVGLFRVWAGAVKGKEETDEMPVQYKCDKGMSRLLNQSSKSVLNAKKANRLSRDRDR